MGRNVAAIAVSAALLVTGLTAQPGIANGGKPGDDAVVVAVIDSGFSPYHWDFVTAKMPQASTPRRDDDLPLDAAPHTWLRGFPKPRAFASYQSLRLSLDVRNKNAAHSKLYEKDKKRWQEIAGSSDSAANYYWIPGTKVIGALSFDGREPRVYGRGPAEHGQGSASVAVGNIHGTCPECLLVFIQASSATAYESALEWAERQPWIDAISNSYGLSTTVLRDRVYAGSDIELQRRATERGQTIFFSAGNGLTGDFVTPNTTLLSSQEGPDWIVTVGATDPSDVDYTGSGKPADIAGIGAQYPSAYGGTTVTGSSWFSGTSNATPTIAGTYGRTLWLARVALGGPSRIQMNGQIARGSRFLCGSHRKTCELGDGILTRQELERRLFAGAIPTARGTGHPASGRLVPRMSDERRLSEGYGTYRARLDGYDAWLREFSVRIWEPIIGFRDEPLRPAGETEWFRVDSWCRQRLWGPWRNGAYRSDATTPLPAADAATPARNAYFAGCQVLTRPPR